MKCGTQKRASRIFVFSVVKSGKICYNETVYLYIIIRGVIMRKTVKLLSVITAFVLIAAMFSSCSIGTGGDEPEKAYVKTDLHDAEFTFTYAQLKPVFSPDNISELTALFENTDDINDDSTVQLNYNDIRSRYYDNKRDIFDGIMNLLSDSEKALLYDNSEAVLNYFNENFNRVKTERPQTEPKEDFWIDDNTVKISGEESKTLNNAFKLYKDFVQKGLKDDYFPEAVGEKCKQGTDLTDKVYLLGDSCASRLTMDDVQSVITSLTPTYEKDTDENNVPVSYSRTIIITLKNDPSAVAHAFSPHDKSAILSELKKGESYFSVSDYEIAYNSPVIIATFDAVTDEVAKVEFYKNMTITSYAKGEGSLSYIGDRTVTFNCTDNMNYIFNWHPSEEDK